MVDRVLEARFEEQIEELTDRLHECLQLLPSPDAVIARGILEGLIRGYQEQLSELRKRRAAPPRSRAAGTRGTSRSVALSAGVQDGGG